MRTMLSERAQQENGFLVLTLVTLHVQEHLRRYDEDCLNTLIQMIHASVLENWQMWWIVTIPPSCDICIQWTRLKKIECSKPKTQKSVGGHMCISACLPSIGSWTTSTISILYCYWCWEMVLYVNIRKRKEWLSPNKRRICRKFFNFSTWHSIF